MIYVVQLVMDCTVTARYMLKLQLSQLVSMIDSGKYKEWSFTWDDSRMPACFPRSPVGRWVCVICVWICVCERLTDQKRRTVRKRKRQTETGRPCLKKARIFEYHLRADIHSHIFKHVTVYEWNMHMCILSQLIVVCLSHFADPTSGGSFFGP